MIATKIMDKMGLSLIDLKYKVALIILVHLEVMKIDDVLLA